MHSFVKRSYVSGFEMIHNRATIVVGRSRLPSRKRQDLCLYSGRSVNESRFQAPQILQVRLSPMIRISYGLSTIWYCHDYQETSALNRLI